jgi:long-subunit acyl-CoA synthetase (AMP-forming)
MAASEGTARSWRQVTGSVMVEGWGMSETCAIGTNNPVNSGEFSGTIGLPLPRIDLAIKDDEGRSLAIGETGEICIKGPNITPGYFQKPEEKARMRSRRTATFVQAMWASSTNAATRRSSTARRT